MQLDSDESSTLAIRQQNMLSAPEHPPIQLFRVYYVFVDDGLFMPRQLTRGAIIIRPP